MKENKYKVKIGCKNCGLKKEIEIEKGKEVSDQECPECGCRKLSRMPKQVKMSFRPQSYR